MHTGAGQGVAMSAKKAQKPSAAPGTVPQQGLLDSIQSEVSKEASPLLDFLTRNTGAIIGGFLLFIAIIGGYWFYTNQSQKSLMAEQRALGNILVMADHQARIKALEAYLPKAPAALQTQVHIALAESAMNLEDFDLAFTYWGKLKGVTTEMTNLSAGGMAQARKAQGKFAESIALYESILPGAKAQQLVNINREIVIIAEIAGNYQRAVVAAEALASNMDSSETDRMIWGQKVHALRASLEAKEAPLPDATPAAEAPASETPAAATPEQQGGN